VSADYPSHRKADVVLSNGSTVRLRPLRPDDERRLLEFFSGLDPRSQGFRFFSGAVDLPGIAHLLAEVDYGDRYGLIATRGDEDVVVGHGSYIRLGPGRAEVAFAVAEALQGHGLGTILLAHLTEVAAEHGIESFVAEVMPENHRMVEMFRKSGFPAAVHAEPGALRVEIPTSLEPAAVELFEDRDRRAAVAAVRAIFEPASVAVIGASRNPGRVGGAVLANLRAAGSPGALYPVNRAGGEVQGVAAATSVAAIEGEVELAVIAVPATDVVAVARECAAKGVRALVVLSAGFAESGPEGTERERELLAVCRGAGIRLVGPNCLGVLSTDPERPLNATFAPAPPPPGGVGLSTQSGALGLALIELAGEGGVGVSSFASVGNRADVTGSDLLEYWEQDPRTAVALLYIESFSNPRRFSRVARRIGRQKPIVAVKSGGSAAGARAASSHTGALLAASDRATEALFDQSGVIRAETLAELFEVTSLLSTQPLPAGGRVAILTNSGGPAIMCADACEGAGLEVPELPEEVRAELAAFLPAEAALANPVDMIATAGPAEFRRAIGVLAGWEGIDALIAIFVRPLATAAEEVAAAIGAAVAELPRPLPMQAAFISAGDPAALREIATIPTHRFPEAAANALGKVVRHVRWRHRPASEHPALSGIRGDEAKALLAEALAEGREWLDPERCRGLLDAYGIATPASHQAASPTAAGRAAAALGGPVALKAVGPEILHKTELGAVRLGLSGPTEVARAAREIDAELERHSLRRESFLVQEMAGDGVEMLVGIATDPVFGPVLACGAGGTAVELIGDVQLRVCPLEAGDPAAMLDGLAIRPLLDGYRGSAAADVASLEATIARVGAIAAAHPEIVELDLNPVLATPHSAIAVDFRVRLHEAPPPVPWPKTWD